MIDVEYIEAHERELERKEDYLNLLHGYLEEFISEDALKEDLEYCFQEGRVIGAYHEERLIGAAAGVHTPFFDKFHIAHLAVEEEFQGKGIGSRLVEEVVPENASASVHLNVDNPGLEEFYEKLDFQLTHKRFKKSTSKNGEFKPSD